MIEETYLVLSYGTGQSSKRVIELTKKYAPNSKRVPSHVCAIVPNLGHRWIFEAHNKPCRQFNIPAGVRHTKVEVWEKVEPRIPENYCIVPMSFDLLKLEELIGQPYSTLEIFDHGVARVFDTNGKQKDRNGFICSEYLALCQKKIDGIPLITEQFNLPAHCITPAHWQAYVDVFGKAIEDYYQKQKAGACG